MWSTELKSHWTFEHVISSKIRPWDNGMAARTTFCRLKASQGSQLNCRMKGIDK